MSSLKCYGQRTKSLSTSNFGHITECPKNVTSCVTGIGTLGKRDEKKNLELIGRACLSPEKASAYCGSGRPNCQYTLKEQGLVFKLCFHCCHTDLCNNQMPQDEDKHPGISILKSHFDLSCFKSLSFLIFLGPFLMSQCKNLTTFYQKCPNSTPNNFR